ncbi:MAG: TonB-dependent receptor [Bacteroidota bacterium]
MNRNLSKLVLGLVFISFFGVVHAQTTITGSVTDTDSNEPLLGVNVLVKGTVLGTITDIEGNFSLTVKSTPPFTLVVSFVGYDRKEIEVDAGKTQFNVQLTESAILGQEVVVSASRIEESTLKSPISIERMDILDIQNAPTPDFYGSIRNLNGVDFSTQSLTFKSVNARGFGANGNVRFVQLIDGIDNQAPGLNFPVGNAVGIGELDLESIELIPGAASALYGPNALQGILLMKSKSPFDYQGLDFYTKVGVTHVDEEDHPMSLYRDSGIRYAKSINNKFAFKINASWLRAQDFIGVDERDQSFERNRTGTIEGSLGSNRLNNRIYDGVNTYGEFPITVGEIADVAIAGAQQSGDLATAGSLGAIRSLLPSGENGLFTPTGYLESDVLDNTTESIKFGTALHYRLNDKIEASAQFNWGEGSSVYTANDRFVLDGFSIWTGKLELRADNFFVRAYTTQEDAGDSYAANTLTQRVNQSFYLEPYLGAYADFLTGGNTTGANPNGVQFASNDYDNLHQAAKAVADAVQPQPGSEAYENEVTRLRALSIADGGARFLDKSALWHYEGSYNFKNQIDWADIVVGGNFRTYDLNSEGTLFALDDNGEEVSINEFGGYLQVSKDVLDDLKLQGSVRYDKNENFDGQFSPRISGVWEFLDNQNFRVSYQRGFRIPDTQSQFIDLDVVSRRLLGRNEFIASRYNFDRNTVYTVESVELARQTGNVGDLQVAEEVYEEFETEKVGTWEVGYKSLLLDGKLLIDAFYYNSTYQDFGAEVEVVQAVALGADGAILTGDGAIPGADYIVGTGQRHADAELDVFVNGAQGITTQNFGYDTNL